MQQIIQSFKSGELWLADVPVPACKSGGAVVQTRASFVSAGTERMLVDFAKKNMVGKALAMPDQVNKVIRKMKTEGVFETLEKVKAKLDQPIPLGYSCAGVIEELGHSMRGFAVGDRVACGGAGFANHADYNYVPKNLMVKIPEGVSFEDASCATVGSIAMQGVRQCDVRLGEQVCVMGLGLLGLLAVQMLRASGCRVIGFDPNPQRCQDALNLGADAAVSADLVAACDQFSQGVGVDAVLITAATKSNEPVTVAGEIARMKGKVVVTGLVGMDLPRDDYYKKELDFKLSLSYGPGRYDSSYEEGGNDYPYGYVRWTEQRNIAAFLDLVAAGAVTPSKLVTHRFGIADALDAYDLLLGKTEEPYLGIVLNYDEKPAGALAEGRRVAVGKSGSGDGAKNTGGLKSGEVNIGFIGAGNFTKAVLLPELKKRIDVNLKTLCTATGMNAGETAKKEGFEIASTDYESMLSDASINTVFVTTQHNSHAKFVGEALAAGKHVFVEKPLAITREQMERLKVQVDGLSLSESAASLKGTAAASDLNTGCTPVLMVGFNRRFSPHATLLKDYFSKRKTPVFMSYRVNAGIIPPDVWIQDPAVGGGRIIGEGCHFIDFASHVIGQNVVEVQAQCVTTDNAGLVAEDNVSINLKYADGSVANILYVALGSTDIAKERCEIFANESVAVMEDFCTTTCSGKLGKEKLTGKQAKGFAQELDAFVEAIKEGKESPISWESLVNTTEVSFAVHEALQTKSTVVL
ncbi:bi-domain-containing oxidoreductase [Sulfuriroseicoccus oceanibius]|uniref:Bi-domain-containing oxidoreductase n=1 Tax=Sulfuriroseicoccus oceanibius TaxID=2707525 RepID=A0A6B3LAX2_9BACT|nr:bi-domain-containing oxidoreductase [Sulfuriroseicoccus oceanibius]QQL44310.1 bi-domain-containing oxidoreductase [Sulfuriroseicoccus oceanibius]